MAKKTDVQYIASSMGLNYVDRTIVQIAKKTINEFDLEAAINDLAMYDKPKSQDVINAINSNPIKTETTICMNCKKGWIHVVNRQVLRDQQANGVKINTPLLLPKALAPCPNCGKEPDTLAKRISKMNEEELAWTFVILYEFAVYSLQLTINEDQFNLTLLWPSIEINPRLNEQHRAVIHEIQTIAKHRFVTAEHFPEMIQNEVTKLTNTQIPF